MKHLFFVEDDLSLINGLSFALNKEGYAVDVARTKQEAEALWLKEKFDLVILDVSLPDGSGYDLCRQIRQTSTVPIIFLTAADEETEIIMGLVSAGMITSQNPSSWLFSFPGSTRCFVVRRISALRRGSWHPTGSEFSGWNAAFIKMENS